jgi:hypothetical protein
MNNESKANAEAAEASWVESLILEAKSAQVLIEGIAISDDLLPQRKESK